MFTSITNRVRICPTCNDHQLNYREVCPRCQSIDIHEREVLHHFSCGHIDVLDNYRKGTDLSCPKCNKILRHIGLDYERPTNYFQCNTCRYISPEPEIQVQCLQCGITCQPDETLERIVFDYHVTEEASQAISRGQLGGLNLEGLLRDHISGLYSRQYFEFQTEKELRRAKRYKHNFSTVMVRVNDLIHIKDEHADYLDNYLESVLTAVTGQLRLLDTPCVWDIETIAILLPETDSEGVKIVMDRMKKQVEGLEYLYHIHIPTVKISCTSFTEQITDHLAMLKETYNKLVER